MAEKTKKGWQKTKYPGVRFREHSTRKNGVGRDRYFAIRYQRDGDRIEEGLGWASEGWSSELAAEKLGELKKAARTGEGLKSLRDRRDASRKAEAEAKAKAKQEITMSSLVNEYVERYAKRNKKTWKEDKRALEKDVIPLWGTWKAHEVKRRDAAKLLESIVDRGAPVQACNVLEKCRKLFNKAIEWGYVESNPFAVMERPVKKVERDRVLSEDEIRLLWGILDESNVAISMSAELRRAFKLILLTGQRPGEVIGMHRQEINDHWWTIPAERAKNNKAHLVYLTDTALALIDEGKEYIFPSPKGKKPISENALAMSLRRNIQGAPDGRKVKGKAGRKKKYAELKEAQPISKNRMGINFFRPHDLRRTAVTGMARMKIAYEVRERVVGHALPKLEKTYNLHDYQDEKRLAMEKWEREIERIVYRKSADVVHLYG